jgi:SAM-dependent methyltransferase
MYKQVIEELRQAYDRMAEEREKRDVAPWKVGERNRFLSLLQKEGKVRLLDIGAGTGIHGKFFQDNGLEVVCTDLSPELVKLCRRKGLSAHVMDFLNLEFPAGSFDAVFAMNCLLHVPRNELAQALAAVRDVLKPSGLFFWGQYGGVVSEGRFQDDRYEPQRFFCFLTDEDMQRLATKFFELQDFQCVLLEGDDTFHFQSMILRRADIPLGQDADA